MNWQACGHQGLHLTKSSHGRSIQETENGGLGSMAGRLKEVAMSDSPRQKMKAFTQTTKSLDYDLKAAARFCCCQKLPVAPRQATLCPTLLDGK